MSTESDGFIIPPYAEVTFKDCASTGFRRAQHLGLNVCSKGRIHDGDCDYPAITPEEPSE